jgi:hypothetical protein
VGASESVRGSGEYGPALGLAGRQECLPFASREAVRGAVGVEERVRSRGELRSAVAGSAGLPYIGRLEVVGRAGIASRAGACVASGLSAIPRDGCGGAAKRSVNAFTLPIRLIGSAREREMLPPRRRPCSGSFRGQRCPEVALAAESCVLVPSSATNGGLRWGGELRR